jgi:hypothetical protein
MTSIFCRMGFHLWKPNRFNGVLVPLTSRRVQSVYMLSR